VNPGADDALAALIEGYLEGTIDEDGARTLAGLVQSGGAQARRIRDLVATAGLISLSYDPVTAVDMARSVDEHLTADAQYSDLLRSVSAAIVPRRSWAKTWIGLGALVAALLLVLVNLATYTIRTGPRASAAMVQKLEPAPATIAVLHGPLQPDRAIAAGERVTVPEGSAAVLIIDHEPTICTLDGADCILMHGSPGIILRLLHGGISAEVAHQPPGVHVTISTAQAVVTVIGTRFIISADAARTQLKVLQGLVAFRDRLGGTTAVAAGEAVASQALPASARPASTTVLPVAETWSPLFPGGALAAWTQQHGAWHSEQGTIVGEDRAGGPARILSTRSLGDFTMACRMRILRINWAEIQLLGYNVFVPVAPAQPGTWQYLVVNVRAGQVSATCNGQAVHVQPGLDLGVVRFGILSFYVRPGGRCEIRDAQFCENPDLPLPPR